MNQGSGGSALNRAAAEVCQKAELSDEAKPLVKPQQTVKQLLDALVAKKDFQQANKVLAHALAKRAAVWWGCQCVRQTLLPTATPDEKAALAAAEKWVADPSEDNRRAAQAASEKAGIQTPAGCTALAVFLSGGSLGPPNVPVVPPAEHLTAHALGGSLALAGVLGDPTKVPERFAKFYALGLDVDAGKSRWPESVSQSKR